MLGLTALRHGGAQTEIPQTEITHWTGNSGVMCRGEHARCHLRTKMQIKFFTNDISQTNSLDKLGLGKECGRGLMNGRLEDSGHLWEAKPKYRDFSNQEPSAQEHSQTQGCSFYSRCGPWTSCISITWGIVGTIYSRAPPGTTETESVVAVCPG